MHKFTFLEQHKQEAQLLIIDSGGARNFQLGGYIKPGHMASARSASLYGGPGAEPQRGPGQSPGASFQTILYESQNTPNH